MNDLPPETGTAPPSEMSDAMSEIPLERAETGASLPAPEEVRMSGTQGTRRRFNTWLCYGIFFLVLLSCFVALGVGLSNRNSSGSSMAVPGGNVRQFSVEDLAAYLEEQGISSSDDVFSFSTPQAQAARWLADEDSRNLVLPTVGVDQKQGYNFVTRYILAVMYYAFGGPAWPYQYRFLTQGDHCTWRDTRQNIYGEDIRVGVMCDDTSGEMFALFLGTSNAKSNHCVPTLPLSLTLVSFWIRLELVGWMDSFGTHGPDVATSVELEL